MAKRPRKEGEQPVANDDAEPVRWVVFRMRGKAERLGTVEAKDQAQAIARACEVFGITDAERWRISAQRE